MVGIFKRLPGINIAREIYKGWVEALIQSAAERRVAGAPGSRRNQSRGAHYAPNGKREVARRLGHIAAGRLTAANGLVRGVA